MPVAMRVSSGPDVAAENLEAGRLVTFEENKWPYLDGPASRQNMAKAGFFHTGSQDIVKCFICNIKLAGWDYEDEPWSKHLEASPNCLFARLQKEEGNLTIEEWLDMFCSKAIIALDQKINQIGINRKAQS